MDKFLVDCDTKDQKRKSSSSFSTRAVVKKSKLFGGAEGQGPKKSSQLWDRRPQLRNFEALKGKQYISDRFPLGFDHVNLPEH